MQNDISHIPIFFPPCALRGLLVRSIALRGPGLAFGAKRRFRLKCFGEGAETGTHGAYARQKSPDSFGRIFVVRLYRARLVTQKPMCLNGLIDPGLCARIDVHALRGFVIRIERHALQTQFPPSRIELWNAPQFRLPSLHSVLITSAARNPIATIATQINGHSTTNQKELL